MRFPRPRLERSAIRSGCRKSGQRLPIGDPSFPSARWLLGAHEPDLVRKFGIAEQTYVCGGKEYGARCVDQAKRSRELEKESVRLEKLIGE